MPTPNMSDEELDSLFQRGAEAYPDDNYLAGWERMEIKLNAATKAQALRQKVRRLFAAEIVVLSVLLWQGYEFTRTITATEPQRPTTMQPARGAQRTLASAATETPVATHNAASDSIASAYNSKAMSAADAIQVPAKRGQQVVDQQGNVASSIEHVPTGKLLDTSAYGRGGGSPVEHTSAGLVAEHLPMGVGTGSRSEPSMQLPAAGAVAGRVAPVHGSLSIAGLVRPTRRPTAATSGLVPGTPKEAPRHASLDATRKTQRDDKRNDETAAESRVLRVTTGPNTPSSKALATELPASALREATVDSLQLRNGALAAGALGLPLPTAPTQVAVQHPTDSAATKKHPSARPAYRVMIGVLGAPAASAVRTAQSARLGGDVGLTLEYRFTNRLRVRTGLISSEKRYEALSTDYTVPASWQWYNSDYEVNGSCRITEIPIDLRYDVLSRPAYMVFASVGLNSLFMRDERYSYDWMQNGQTFTKEAHVVDGSHHVLSVLNFSAGVERKLGARWSGQVEPFLQLPLGGVGAGQVRLSSLGAAFSLKFGLFR
jgi:hypothetical protein